MAAYDPFLAALNQTIDRPPEYRRAGTLQVAFDDEAARDLTELARVLADADVEHQRLDGTAARSREAGLSSRVIAALEIPAHAYVVPDALVEALVEGATRLGAGFSTATVTSIGGVGAAARVQTDAGDYEADAVVLAAGSWVSELTNLPRESVPTSPIVRPIRGQLLHLKSCTAVASRVLWGPGCYIVPRLDGTVLVGATAEDVGFDERATMGGVRGLLNAAAALAPGLDGSTLESVRVGLRPATADELPIIGPSATMPQAFYAAGHYRSGVLLAPLTAGLVADLVLDGRAGPELAVTQPARFGL